MRAFRTWKRPHPASGHPLPRERALHPRCPYLKRRLFVQSRPDGLFSDIPHIPESKRIRRLSFYVDPYVFRLQVLLNRFHAAFTADTGSLVTTKRRHITRDPIAIHPDRSRFQPFAHRERAANAARPDGGGQTIDR